MKDNIKINEGMAKIYNCKDSFIAEFYSIILAMKQASILCLDNIIIYNDNFPLVSKINNNYVDSISDHILINDFKSLLYKFGQISFVWKPKAKLKLVHNLVYSFLKGTKTNHKKKKKKKKYKKYSNVSYVFKNLEKGKEYYR